MKNEGSKLTRNSYTKDLKEDEKNQSLSDLIVNASLISNESDDVETKMRRLIALLTKFSDAMSSMPRNWRRYSLSMSWKI